MTKQEIQARYRAKNKEKIQIARKEYKLKNKEKLKKDSEVYYANNKETILEKAKTYYQENKTERGLYNSNWKKNNRERINTNIKEKRKTDNLFKLKSNIRNLIKTSFKHNTHNKKSKTVDILGCSIEDFKKYIESKFESWMNWDNYGKYNKLIKTWQLDHIIPISSANDENETIRLNHYTNFQPLESLTNIQKSNK